MEDMTCTECGEITDPVGMGDCNGWECPKCGNTDVDIASFKLNGGDI